MKYRSQSYMLLKKTYFPEHSENRMSQEGDIAAAREEFFNKRRNSIEILLDRRFAWMNNFLQANQTVMELGAGAAFTREYLKYPITTTDVTDHPWIDRYLDANNIDLAPESVDVFILSHMLHHIAQPVVLLRRLYKYLKPGGLILLSEVNTTFSLKLILRVMRHEGWSDEVEVFDEASICNQADDPWSANCAIPRLMFLNKKRFEEKVPEFEIIHFKQHEHLLFPLSGGVISKARFIPDLPKWVLKVADGIDNGLTKLAPNFFAMGMQIALKKR